MRLTEQGLICRAVSQKNAGRPARPTHLRRLGPVRRAPPGPTSCRSVRGRKARPRNTIWREALLGNAGVSFHTGACSTNIANGDGSRTGSVRSPINGDRREARDLVAFVPLLTGPPIATPEASPFNVRQTRGSGREGPAPEFAITGRGRARARQRREVPRAGPSPSPARRSRRGCWNKRWQCSCCPE